MGGSESKSINGDRPNEDEQYHTPIANRRVQTLIDPRSPTDDVNRTPMQRTMDDDDDDDDFQDPRSPTIKIARTPVPDDSDPRSPTGGREPGPFIFPTVPEDPRSPTRIARTPITKDAPIGSSIETVTVHQPDTKEPCESTSNNNQDNNVISTSDSNVEDSEPGVFQIETDKKNLVEEDECARVEETQKSELVDSNTPEYEMELTKMVEKQTIANEETDDQDQATLVLTDRETIFLAEAPSSSSSSSKAKKSSIPRSLKFHTTSTSQRSPLSTRNLLQDSPDPAHRANARQARMGVAYQKTGVRQRLTEKHHYTVQTVGRYQPVLDKENC